ncbi:type II toxin-antitoxin system RelE/ParE family toxin [Massilia sp. CCM 8734]|uniref:type II toxin-antitoxin system RelE/ParE family toxin n=1 Tax=Massilia sp. CCM 8734 TaxID=2609283 RepID=UPI001E4D75A8|nr:type II toxin-antitoxin system RelE/ParE family toxin [Massilia sp. CCM 8734]
MPQVRFSRRALIDLKRLREFLRPQSQAAAKRATEAIVNAIGVLKQHPCIGRPISDMPDGYHEVLIFSAIRATSPAIDTVKAR